MWFERYANVENTRGRTEVGTTGDCRSVPEAVKRMKMATPETMQRGPLRLCTESRRTSAQI
jgi:hypothetical protein